MQDNYAHCEALVREADKDRFLATLFAPARERRHLFALYAFNAEVARVREAVHEPLPGEVRLQWWRDVLQGAGRGDVQAHPVAAALLDTIAAFRLPIDPLLALTEARSFDLYPDPMPTLQTLQGYAHQTASSVIELAAIVLAGGRDPALGRVAGPAGSAWAFAVLLRAFPLHAARGQLYVPLDMLDRHGVDVGDVRSGRASSGVCAALAEMRELVRHNLTLFQDLAPLLPARVGPAFLPVALIPPLLARLEKAADQPFDLVDLSRWRRQWTLWRAARRPVARMI